MGRLSEMIDADDLENRYLGKVILYVESENDANFYKQCVAIGNDEHLEFKGLPQRGGYTAAINKALDERKRNDLVFALVDGEAAVDQDGGLEALLACDTKVFRLLDGTLDGVIFLGEHELENIIIRLADLCSFIARDEPIGVVGRKSAAEIARELDAMIDRQLAGAVCKYASMKMTKNGTMNGALGAVFWDVPEKVTPRILRERVEGKAGDWKAFMGEVRAIRAAIKSRVEASAPGLERHERVRLTDGKTVMALMAHTHSVSPKWHGHLTMSIVGDAYFDELREEIFAITMMSA